MEHERIRIMIRQHAESLLAAGIEWIPRFAAEEQDVKRGAANAEREASALPAAALARQAVTPLATQEASTALGVSGGLFEAPAAPARSTQEKRQALQMLNEQQVVGCPKCAELVGNRTQTVFGVGNAAAELCFVGEAPGADEDRQGEPFVGAAGQLLTRIIAAMKMTRDEVYICNVLKCRPPGNRTPLPNEVANCLPFLEQQLAIIQPRFICALGAVAAQTLLQTTQSIGKLRNQLHRFRGIPVLCTYHPAFLLRSPDKKKEVWDDMKRLLKEMGRPVPN
jgi:uracil-DNA glycosylase family 4